MKPVVNLEITGFLPLTPILSDMLDYLTNVSAKGIAEFAGAKYTEADWKKFRSAIEPTIGEINRFRDRINKACQPETR